MKIKFLGTAAAEGIPALWCECQTCNAAKAAGDKDFRRRCSYAIDDDTMIDFGPDAFWQTTEFGIDLTRLKRVLITHSHPDHLNPLEFQFRRTPWFSQVTKELTVAGSRRVLSRILCFTAEDSAIYQFSDLHIRPLEMRDGTTIEDGDMKITTLAADHAPGKEAQLYLVERDRKRFFIANDTGLLPEKSWEQLRGIKLDLVSIDTTLGFPDADNRHGHLGVNTVIEFRDRLQALGCLKPETQVYANHFSHNGHALHRDLEAFFLPRGMKVAYDGLTVTL